MCFAPQRRALFRHLSLQKWSEPLVVFWTFWLGNVLCATTACTFPTSQLPKVVRTWCVLYILTWNVLRATTACTFFDIVTSKSGPTLRCFVHFDLESASRHNGVHFFDISTSKSAPSTRCFVHFDLQMCFAPQRRAIFHLSSGQLAPHPPLSEPTFRPSGAPNHWKNSVSRLSYLFTHLHLLSSYSSFF